MLLRDLFGLIALVTSKPCNRDLGTLHLCIILCTKVFNPMSTLKNITRLDFFLVYDVHRDL